MAGTGLREAVDCLKHALIPADPHEITINLKLARLHHALEEPAEAIAYHRKVVEVCQADLRPIQDYAKSSLEVAEYQMRIPNGDLVLARDYLEIVASSNAEDVGRAAELLKNVKATIHARAMSADTEAQTQELCSRLASDHALVLNPDIDTPFLDTTDVLHKLLPYHVFLQPQEDLDTLTRSMKGKGKATETELEAEFRETKFAIECHKRRDALVKRFRDIQTRQGKRTAPDDQAVLVASLVLDVERSDTTLLSNELRTVRAEHERREKERRMVAHVARPAYYGPGPVPPAAATAVSTQYYRGYPYAYAQVYGSTTHANSTPVAFSVPPAPLVPSPVPAQSAIPVQLPVASLPALHALGIVPVPAASLPVDGQSQPAAILRGSSSNGSMLSLEINVSSLQSAQMSGLAMVLNSLMSKSNPSVNSSNLDSQPSSAASGNEAT
ncbi:hypothetical protein C0992_006209 [Termitomyces sp. T32_za158]|nr:hypothetical protein C0992_006209 [Termitomyces sp. T32_za158]